MANKNKSYGFDKKKDQLRKRGEILRWLAAAKALVDVVLSVAACVIASLLVKSGDIEENPGPGGNNELTQH